ncbi:putative succinyl-CoA synthetase subunit alpha [Aspergillus novofumigatus IBT 16806]|uniref:Putative succinyl-CoA synthetase subunit alpha n=1 Tax=Aspergillus novofumigatus (strain IBT 16806) TaxID=1392255 RepID=A0A2I1C9L9_ASPN1|nr:putative succinyl-CoA synthetase subunit alpha [Aspergillus novofumigatus IBT 16806]PKX94286.1 putative succinyl-CoA synthetase subunit alpha [Aspergillus novofumigatus IBT 16806]
MTGLRLLPLRARKTSILRLSRFSTSSRKSSYADTLPNLKIGAHTRVLFQGFTGAFWIACHSAATANVKESLAWGTKIVGGVKPGVEGEHLGLPVFPSVQAAQERAKPDASAIYAMEEAIEAEIPLVVAVAEHVPIHDMLRVHSMLQTQSKTRLVGANCPGIISAIGKCRIGFQPLPCFSPGKIGIVAKSGTLSYETVASTTRAGLGQSLCISMGGDVLAGTNFVDALKVFEEDPDTEGIILVGEIGGTAEIDAAEWIRDYNKRAANPKGPPGRVMGHAGAWIAPGEPGAVAKHRALESAGVTMVDHPEKFGQGMKALLARRTLTSATPISSSSQKRGLHTMRRLPHGSSRVSSWSIQKRSLYVKEFQALEMLKRKSISVNEAAPSDSEVLLTMTVDRTALSPCIVASTTPDLAQASSTRFPFAYTTQKFSSGSPVLEAVASHLQLPETARGKLAELTQALWEIFKEKEAYLLEVRANFNHGEMQVRGARFGFDDAAFRSSGRQEDVHRLRNKEEEVPEEVEAEKDGIVYVKYVSACKIAAYIIVNGAGLAMNTVDALSIHGGHCANFLDTGGKATSETVKSSFRIIRSDPRVKAIFVNIFGGLTRCDMIAEGIIMAFRDLEMNVPVVVRLRGTNEELGQKMIAESGLPLHAFDSFEDAAKKVISLARSTQCCNLRIVK